MYELDYIKNYADTVATKVAALEAEIKNLKNEQSGVIKPYLPLKSYDLSYLESITDIAQLSALKDELIKTFTYNKDIVEKNATIYKENIAVKNRLIMLITNTGLKKTRIVRKRGRNIEIPSDWLSDLAILTPTDISRIQSDYNASIEKINSRISKIQSDISIRDKGQARDQYLVEKGKAILKYNVPLEQQNDHWSLINYLRTNHYSSSETVEILENLKRAM